MNETYTSKSVLSYRRQSREVALQFLYQNRKNGIASDAEFKAHFEISNQVWPYAKQLLEGVEKNKSQIDALIESQSKNWKFNRILIVDLLILRVATFELICSQEKTDKAVIINEALEISKKYSSKKSSQFINGILEAISKKKK